MVVTGTAQFAHAQAPPEKKVKDQGEYDIFNQTIKDASNPAQQIKDLDTWTQKYPDSDYKDDRLYYYIQAYNATNQPAKVLEIGSQLMGRDLKTVFKDPKSGPQQVLTVLYLMSVNILKLQTATPEQLAAGRKGRAIAAGLRRRVFHRGEQAREFERCRLGEDQRRRGGPLQGRPDEPGDRARARMR